LRITLNGDEREVDDSVTVAAVVIASVEGDPSRGVAVALNGEVVPKREWERIDLAERDRVEILRAIGGG
jgi:sulfur carrier protein